MMAPDDTKTFDLSTKTAKKRTLVFEIHNWKKCRKIASLVVVSAPIQQKTKVLPIDNSPEMSSHKKKNHARFFFRSAPETRALVQSMRLVVILTGRFSRSLWGPCGFFQASQQSHVLSYYVAARRPLNGTIK